MAVSQKAKRKPRPVPVISTEKLIDSFTKLEKATEVKEIIEPAIGKIETVTGKMINWPPMPGDFIEHLPLSYFSTKTQPRKKLFDVDALALAKTADKNIDNGLPQFETPITGHWDEDSKTIKIRNGHRRYRGATLDGWKGIDVVVKSKIQLVNEIFAQLKDNLHKEDMDPWDLALSIQDLKIDYSLSYEEIGKALGKSKTWVSDHTRAGNLPDYIEEFANTYITSDLTIFVLLKTAHSLDEEKTKIFIEGCTTTKKITRAQVRRHTKKLRNGDEETETKIKNDQSIPFSESTYSSVMRDLGSSKDELNGADLRIVTPEGEAEIKGFRLKLNENGEKVLLLEI